MLGTYLDVDSWKFVLTGADDGNTIVTGLPCLTEKDIKDALTLAVQEPAGQYHHLHVCKLAGVLQFVRKAVSGEIVDEREHERGDTART